MRVVAAGPNRGQIAGRRIKQGWSRFRIMICDRGGDVCSSMGMLLVKSASVKPAFLTLKRKYSAVEKFSMRVVMPLRAHPYPCSQPCARWSSLRSQMGFTPGSLIVYLFPIRFGFTTALQLVSIHRQSMNAVMPLQAVNHTRRNQRGRISSHSQSSNLVGSSELKAGSRKSMNFSGKPRSTRAE